MKKNDKFIGIVENYTYDGMGCVKVEGFPFFIANVVQGEEIEFVVTMMKKNFGYGKATKIIVASKERVVPDCPLFPQCGGCQIQHLSAKEQGKLKEDQVRNLMRRVAKIDTEVNPILTMDNPWNYRNKAQVPVSDDGVCGFYRVNSNTIIPMNECKIQSKEMNQIYQEIKRWVETFKRGPIVRHILLKEAKNGFMVVLIVKNKKIAYIDELVERLKRNKNIKSVYLNINTRTDNVILGEEEVLVYGEPTIMDELHDFTFSISPKSFYQVNPIQTEVLYQSALDLCDLQGNERVIDLYCGVGTISMFLAQKAKEVIGIDIVESAINDARDNAERNNINNLSFICADAGAFAMELANNKEEVDIVVIDPPRKGCEQQTINAIALMNPTKIVYVSCDPSTLARDIARFKEHNYVCTVVQPVDMFPQTYHVESVVLLTKG